MWQGILAPDAAGELLGNAVISGKSQTCFLSVVPCIKIFGLGDEITLAGRNIHAKGKLVYA